MIQRDTLISTATKRAILVVENREDDHLGLLMKGVKGFEKNMERADSNGKVKAEGVRMII